MSECDNIGGSPGTRAIGSRSDLAPQRQSVLRSRERGDDASAKGLSDPIGARVNEGDAGSDRT